MERRFIDINTVNAFIEKSNTPLPLKCDTSFLAGNTLEIKGRGFIPLFVLCFKCKESYVVSVSSVVFIVTLKLFDVILTVTVCVSLVSRQLVVL